MKECANQTAADLIARRSEYLAHGNLLAPLLDKVSRHSNETEQRDQYGNECKDGHDTGDLQILFKGLFYLLVYIRMRFH